MGKQPTFLMGVGATKAGTTWLYDYLSRHPDCHLRAIKELHYFDTLKNNAFGRQLKLQKDFVERLEARMAVAKGANAELPARKRRDVLDWIAVLEQRIENLPDYLAYLQGGDRAARHLVGDITPSYALLPVERLRRMAQMASDVRFVYLMRDPVSRLWSHVRMIARRAAASADALPDAAFATLDKVLQGGEADVTRRGDYIGALKRLAAAVDPRKLLVMFQEDMMTPAGLARLCGFLGIANAPAEFDKRVHAGVALAMTADQRSRARAMLRPQYEYVARHYPDLPENWRRNMGEDAR